MRLKGKIALVTGSTSGIGKATASLFADEGSNVVLTGRSTERLAEISDKIRKTGVDILAVPADLTRLGDIDDLVEKTLSKFGRIDILVNAAGIFEGGDFFEASEEFFDRTMNSNVKSVFFVSQRVAGEMKKQRKGRIVNFSSVGGGKIGFPGGSAYCASKAAIAGLTMALAIELAPYHINVNAVSPGNILSPMNEQLFNDPAYRKKMLDITPGGRIGEPLDAAYAALYLASDDSDYVTGLQLTIDGGMTTGPGTLLQRN